MAHPYSQIDNLSVPSSLASGGLRKTAKHIILHDPLINLDKPCSTPDTQDLSGFRNTSACKVSFQESSSNVSGTQHKSSSNPTSKPISALKQYIPYTPNLKTKSAVKVKLTKAPSTCTTAMFQDIITLKWAFLASCDTIGNISMTYTIRTDPSITQVQPVCKVDALSTRSR